MQTVTIAGKPFQVEPRYAEGHVLTANEASTLNQTFYENIRNNFAGKAKEGGTQEDLDAYVSSYQFGVRTGGGGGSRDPVEVEAMNLARDAVRKGIVAKGKKISDFSAKVISEAAAKLLERNPAYREKAKERVAELQDLAGESLDPSVLEDLAAAAEGAESGEAADDAEGEVEETESAPSSRRGRKAAVAAE